MKKVIVAAAGLMLVGTMASTAMAEFKFSGDARVRYFLQDSYGDNGDPTDVDGDNTETHWSSRTRFNIEADTKGGAYVKTRIRVANHNWGTGTADNNQGINTDYAYIGVPFGPVTVEGGRVRRDISNFFYTDERADSLQLKYKNDMTSLVAFYDLIDEDRDLDENGEVIDVDNHDMFGAVLTQGFSGGWNLLVGALYQANDTDQIFDGAGELVDDSAFGATAQVTGAVGTVALAAELAYQDEGFVSAMYDDGNIESVTEDEGFGGYVSATVPVGAVDLLGVVAFTTDGFIMDHDDFGAFIMAGNLSQIAMAGITNWTEFGDSVFVSIAPSYKVTEQLTIGAEAAYVALDPNEDLLEIPADADDQGIWEIGATASYAVTDGASLNGVIGWADLDELNNDEDAFGVGLELAIKF